MSHVIKFICTIMLEYINVDFKILQPYTRDQGYHPRQLNRQILRLKRWRTKDHKALGQHHIWFWLPLRGFRWVNELQSMMSQHGSRHKFVAWRKRSLCFTEYVFQDIFTWRISQFAKFSSANVFMQWIRQIFPLPKFPSIRYCVCVLSSKILSYLLVLL